MANPNQRRPIGNRSKPVLWYELISEMEAFSQATGLGLAIIWGYIQREDYDKARRYFDALVHTHRLARGGD